MKKITLLLSTIVISLQLSAQLTVKDTAYGEIPINGFGDAKDTLFNTGTFDINIEWRMKPNPVLAQGISGVGNCFLPGACYAFDNSLHTDLAPKNQASYYQVDLKADNTAVKGSKSYITLETDINGGKDLVFIFTTSEPLSINDWNSKLSKIFPQPAFNELNIEMPNMLASKVEILSVTGSKIMEKNIVSDLTAKISIANLNNGYYFINILDANHQVMARKKFVKL